MANEERGTCRECGHSIPLDRASGVVLKHDAPEQPMRPCEGGWKLPEGTD